MKSILFEAGFLEPGETKRIDCPTCGRTGKTLSITATDEGTVLWNCYRASCHERGASGEVRVRRARATPKVDPLRPFTGALEPLTALGRAMLEKEIGWTEEHIEKARPMWAPDDERVAYPVLGPLGVRRGYVLRSYVGGEPKAMTRMDVSEPHLSYYQGPGAPDVVVVVEDIPSAVRASRYVNAVALCGTGCGPDAVAEIADHYRRVVWALDADAVSLAITLHRKNSLLFEHSRVLVLEQDLKNMSEDDLANLLGVVK